MPKTSSIRGSQAEAFLAALASRNIRHVFANGGTDFAPIVEALVARGKNGGAAPNFITVPHENVAMAMAHGYYRATGEMAAVMVHVTVGTANALCGIMNASRDNVPTLLAAGRTPLTETGSSGSRSLGIHWGQENFDQAGVVREHVKWDYELRSGQPVDEVVGRALDIAMSEPRGPVYLSLPREVLGEAAPPSSNRRHSPTLGAEPPAPSAEAIDKAASILAKADMPLIITANGGRSPEGFAALGQLADAYAIPVAQGMGQNLPYDHPMNLGPQPGALLQAADAILVIDSEVPWVPAMAEPKAGAKIIQLASDPLYAGFPFRGFQADLAIAGASALGMPMLHDAMRGKLRGRKRRIAERRREIAAEIKRRAAGRAKLLKEARNQTPIHPAWLAACLNDVLTKKTVLVNEIAVPFDHMKLTEPRSLIGGGLAGGLGTGLGAALGAKLARPDAEVIATVGDGSYMFGVPTAAHFVGAAENLPTLTIVTNNSMWFAVHRATLGMYPNGAAAKANRLPITRLDPSPRFEKTIEACGGYGQRVEDPAELPAALDRALEKVRGGTPALLNVITGAGGRG